MKRLYALLFVWLCACVVELDEEPTQITVRIAASETVERDTERLRVRISPRVDGVFVENTKPLDITAPKLRFPADIPIVPGPGTPKNATLEIIVEAWASTGGEPVLVADARVLTNFVARAQKLLALQLVVCAGSEAGVCELDRSCHGAACASCGPAGTCIPTTLEIPGEKLPDLDPRDSTGARPVEVTPPDVEDDAPSSDAQVTPHWDGGSDGPGTDSRNDAGQKPEAGISGSLPDAGPSDAGSVPLPIDIEPDPHSCSPARSGSNLPFGYHVMPYTEGTKLPSHLFRSERDEIAANAYDRWKANYVVEDECGPGLVHVKAPESVGVRTTSESHGLAMLITVLMAGHDPDAQRLYNGMLNYYLSRAPARHPLLMSRTQDRAEGCSPLHQGSSSEGDLDIAYSLLLADKQWGRTPTVDYRALARAVIKAIKEHDVHPENQYVYLGSRAVDDENDRDATRTSDVMPGHFAAFEDVTGDPSWGELAARELAIVRSVQTPTTGLFPSFVVSVSTNTPKAPAEFFGFKNAGDFSEPASRAPLRIALDYLVRGTPEAAEIVTTMNTWMDTTSEGDPTRVKAGYRLDGTAYTDHVKMEFIAPLGVSAMVSARQDWLNALWDVLADRELDDGSYLGDTLELFALIAMSGNWWAPNAVSCPIEGPPLPDAGTDGDDEDVEDEDDGGAFPVPDPHCGGPVYPQPYPPCSYTSETVPMTVSLGFSDDGNVNGMQWALELAERYDAKFTFFVSCAAANKPGVLDVWRAAARAGHELAPRLTAAQLDSSVDLTGDIEACAAMLDEQILWPEGLLGVHGFRAPGLRYSDELLTAMSWTRLMYDSSIVEGDQEWQDGTDFHWPYHLDYGSPGHNARFAKDPSLGPLGPHQNLFELPVYAVIPPPSLRRNLEKRGLTDPRKVVGEDIRLWGSAEMGGLSMSAEEALATLRYTYDRRIRGNRVPFVLSLHTAVYETDFDQHASQADADARKNAIVDFLHYVLHAEQRAEIVTHRYLYRWLIQPDRTPDPWW